jgi:hypothetical protein
MRKVLDVVLIIAAVAGLAYGAYAVGRVVTRESDAGFSRSSGSTQPTATTPNRSTDVSVGDRLRRHRTAVRIGLVAVAVLLLLWALSAIRRSIERGRRRRRARRY